MRDFLRKLHREESGQDLIEYSLIAALLALACVVGLQNVATAISNQFANIGGYMT
jgi:pilus assembly protein Flp/PilA